MAEGMHGALADCRFLALSFFLLMMALWHYFSRFFNW